MAELRGLSVPVFRNPPTGKWCPRCSSWLPFSAFRPNLRLSDGWSSWCNGCHLEATRRWRKANPEKQAAYNKSRRVPPSQLTCVECGASFEGRRGKLLCSRKCKDVRYARTHPDELREKQRRKDARRRAKQVDERA
jgi:hypothetical protein